jgi:hypothetical protein
MTEQEPELKACPWCGLSMQIYYVDDEECYHVAHAEPFTCPIQVKVHSGYRLTSEAQRDKVIRQFIKELREQLDKVDQLKTKKAA